MIYGDEKVRQISRSVLPATRRAARTASRDKRTFHRRNRRIMDSQIQMIRRGSTATDAVEAYDEGAGVWHDSYSPAARDELAYIVSDRRLSDNLGPVRSWTAHLSTQYDDPSDLIEFISRTFPKNLAGRHALSHMESEFGPSTFLYRRRNEELIFRNACRYAEFLHKVQTVYFWRHKLLNQQIKKNNRSFAYCYGSVMKNGLRASCFTNIQLEDQMYETQILCPKCGGKIRLNNIRPVGAPDDVERLTLDLCRSRFGFGSDGPIGEWIEKQYDLLDGVFYSDKRVKFPHVTRM